MPHTPLPLHIQELSRILKQHGPPHVEPNDIADYDGDDDNSGDFKSLLGQLDSLKRIVDFVPIYEMMDKNHMMENERPGHFQRHW